MKITEVNVTLHEAGLLLAFASITIDNVFVVRGLKVIKGPNGIFIAMPTRERSPGMFQDIAHPITQAARDQLESAVLAKYNEVRGERDKGLAADGVRVPRPPSIGPLRAALRRVLPPANARDDDPLPDLRGAG
ncbi:MAG: septation protein SpoVG family protein [bacterium]